MEHGDISALRIDIWDCDGDKAPYEHIGPIEPQNAIARAWIPQTLGDQIWVMWKFKTQKEREAFEASLPPNVARWIDRRVIEVALPYGWESYNLNGFVNKKR